MEFLEYLRLISELISADYIDFTAEEKINFIASEMTRIEEEIMELYKIPINPSDMGLDFATITNDKSNEGK